MTNSDTIPTLTTDRLILRPFALSDAREVQRLAGHEKVAAATATIPHPYPDGAAEGWISKHHELFQKGAAVDWAIEIKSEARLIGCVSLGICKVHRKAELGYWIGVEFWNQGFCSEASKQAVKYAFEIWKLNKITSRHLVQNPSSGRVMEKIGMRKEGCLRQEFYKGGNFSDVVIYGILSSDPQPQ